MARILLLLHEKDVRRVLRHWLEPAHEVIAPESDAEDAAVLDGTEPVFDLCLVNSASLGPLIESVRARRARERPVFLPFVLLASREEAERASAQVWESVDEVVTVPVLRPELKARVDALLRTRRLSLLAHAELHQIFESTGSGTCVVDTARRITRVNRAFAKASGRGVEELIGADVSEVFASVVVSPEVDLVGAVLDGADTSEAELVSRAPAGKPRVYMATASPFRGLDGELLGAIVDVKDITRLKAIESELRSHKDRLEHALAALKKVQTYLVRNERLHALGQMASSVVHDFERSLSTIRERTEALLGRSVPPLEDDLRQEITAIAKATLHASDVVKGLRSFYRQREASDHRAPLSLDDVLEDAIASTKPLWEDEAKDRGVEITIQRDYQGLPRLVGNDAELREAVSHLIENAVDAMPEGGRITISTRRDEDTAVVEIRDTGSGMDEFVRRKALEPFFTTKGERGTGLGLATAFGVARRHGGSLEVTSAPDQGTTITLRLPLEAGEAPAEEGERPSAVSLRPLRILFVDDHPGLRERFASHLSRDGHAVSTAANAFEALYAFDRSTYDVVVADGPMPGMSGERLATVIKASSPATPVIVLAVRGGSSPDAPRTSMADAVLQKPVSLADLRGVLASIFSK